MKKTIIIIFLLTSLPSFAQMGWQALTISSSITANRKIFFVDTNTGFLTSYAGVFKSTNSGTNWNQIYLPYDPSTYSALYFLNNSTGFFGSYNPSVFHRTTNAGGSWEILNLGDASFSEINFIDSSTGWLLCGQNKKVCKTTNGGNSFEEYIISDSTGQLIFTCMKFINSSTGWVAGSGPVYRTTNGGISWNYISHIELIGGNVIPVYSMDFINEFTGYMVGTSGYIYRTTNGGNNWIKSQLAFSFLSCIKFVNSQTGWTCGYNGELYKTINSGVNWTKINLDSTSNFRNMFFLNENLGWILSNENKIFKTTTGGNVFIMNTSSNVPDKFSLLQNYPNPFNPSTTINFQIPKNNFVSLKVYDINGREISELVNENMNAGEYKINFDGSSLPSGVYYYKLTSDNFSETKKMILIK